MTDDARVPILVVGRYNSDGLESLKARFDVREVPNGAILDLPEAERSRFRGAAMHGALAREEVEALPGLEIVGNFGVGYDGIDAAHAATRSVAVVHTPDVLTDEVADTALALLLMTVRDLERAAAYARTGAWETGGPFPLTPLSLRGRRLGIMGLGRIGLAIAKRAESFGLKIDYHNRSKRSDVAYPYHPTLEALAKACDILLVAAPGGSGTDKAVNGAVLRALGPKGVLVNIGRGSVVDEPALIEALETGTIAAAGLDVFADEPRIPARLRALDNVVLLPHVASASRDTRIMMADLVTENLRLWFEGEALKTPVPESAKAGLTRRQPVQSAPR